MVESAYASLLREHGFALTEDSEKEKERVTRELASALNLPPPKRDRKEEPWFVIAGSETWAYDENGRMWKACGKIDLSPFGFENGAELIREALREFGGTLREQLLGGKRPN